MISLTTIYWHRTFFFTYKTVRVSERTYNVHQKPNVMSPETKKLRVVCVYIVFGCTIFQLNSVDNGQSHHNFCKGITVLQHQQRKKIYAQRMACVSSLMSFSQTISDV